MKPLRCSAFTVCLPRCCKPVPELGKQDPQPLPATELSTPRNEDVDSGSSAGGTPVVPAIDQSHILRSCINNLSQEITELRTKHATAEHEIVVLRSQNEQMGEELQRLRDELKAAKSILGIALITGSPRPHYKPGDQLQRGSIHMHEAQQPQTVQLPLGEGSGTSTPSSVQRTPAPAKRSAVVIPPLRLNKENFSQPPPLPNTRHNGQAFVPASRVRPSFRPTRSDRPASSTHPGPSRGAAAAPQRAPSAPHSRSPQKEARDGRKSAARSLSASAREPSPGKAVRSAARARGAEDAAHVAAAAPPATVAEEGTLTTPPRVSDGQGGTASSHSSPGEGKATTPAARPTPPFASAVPRFAPVVDAARFDVSPQPPQAGARPAPTTPVAPIPIALS